MRPNDITIESMEDEYGEGAYGVYWIDNLGEHAVLVSEGGIHKNPNFHESHWNVPMWLVDLVVERRK